MTSYKKYKVRAAQFTVGDLARPNCRAALLPRLFVCVVAPAKAALVDMYSLLLPDLLLLPYTVENKNPCWRGAGRYEVHTLGGVFLWPPSPICLGELQTPYLLYSEFLSAQKLQSRDLSTDATPSFPWLSTPVPASCELSTGARSTVDVLDTSKSSTAGRT